MYLFDFGVWISFALLVCAEIEEYELRVLVIAGFSSNCRNNNIDFFFIGWSNL